ncbi:hypothetical protein BDZ90DRAFT_124800 [Jaminaea rosea]|uniref:Uncharacterized protein n=1 Tax=Jaminaea rosea TaxID=1569628 RepID=A0A316UMR6_9BASI|nr:hypothetical protein BDZ90DRAFT_124800 [Jaminaea rosea]PWN24465.1 hypothetical protein BDZ90DRAFT_124800 [Jaminaea rosea]
MLHRHWFSCILYAAFSVLHAAADHHTCEWQGPGTLSPEKYGYILFCRAPITILNTTHAEYVCPSVYWLRIMVADYGFLRPETLEVATPCGHKGFARGSQCDYHTWGVCDAPSDRTRDPSTFNCKFIGRKDDCEWPVTFPTSAYAPVSVDIWMKLRGGSLRWCGSLELVEPSEGDTVTVRGATRRSSAILSSTLTKRVACLSLFA